MSNEKLSYKGYEGSVEVSPDGRFTGKVLDIRCGLIYEGLTLLELQVLFKASVTHILITVRAKVLGLKNLLPSQMC